MNKEIVFVGRMQNKTRDYIHNLEREVKLLQQENNRLKKQRQELRSWLEEYKENAGNSLDSYDTGIADGLEDVIRKLNELEQNND